MHRSDHVGVVCLLFEGCLVVKAVLLVGRLSEVGM